MAYAGRAIAYGRGLAAAAAQLGVSEADLKVALGIPTERPQRPDLTAAADQLGVGETDLRETLRSTMHNARQQRQAGNRPNPGQLLTEAANQLGVSENALRSALGMPSWASARPSSPRRCAALEAATGRAVRPRQVSKLNG